jgi:enoyl-CoA hydratase/carnithine racemase
VPVVAKIRGICMGGGLGLAAACDVRIAATDAIFRMPAARLGLGYNFTGIKRFVQLLGAANTSDIFFSARKFDAADAYAMGFLNRVVPVADLDREVAAYCELLVENAPLTMAAAKFAIRQTGTDPAARDMDQLARMLEACFSSEDYREGRKAFMEKRKPNFKGK